MPASRAQGHEELRYIVSSNGMKDVQRWHPVSIEDMLGSADGRFFGEGYRKVGHVFNGWSPSPSEFEGVGHVSYPADWSTDADGSPRTPHLSTIDGVVLPLLIISSTWGHRKGEHVTEVSLRAGSRPWLEIGDIPISIRSIDSSGGPTTSRSFSARVGNLKADITLATEACASYGGAVPKPEPSAVFGDLYRGTHCETVLTDYDRVTGFLLASHHAPASYRKQPGPVSGIEGDYWPALTAVDYLVTAGQVVQALITERYGNDRTRGELWMRSMRISLPNPPQRLPAEFSSRTAPVEEWAIERAGRKIRHLVIETKVSHGVSVTAKLAYVKKG